ncbi:NAD(P)H-dependent oxidoreductase [Engelhardtia mirabilis]|uniref:General stress protein 14 n=1 Tax=Engelhardtia mirabilis TaxID=2528011 RepID=A0A518BDL8_9BACT|nr:General stress protein 14 [Planctomycetes bacterium Pla133]QDU99416.1 General stress protein 14 [Planctomycetes bacterium Pla86]
MQRSILLILSHPAFERSRANRALLEAVRDLEGVRVHDLYEEYPDFAIDVEREQGLLREHDVIVFQHPFYWYSVPSLLKEWMDLVLEYGFAYGHAGHELDGKWWLSVITTGGGVESYCRAGGNRFTMRELTAPLEQTARLCGMHFLPPFLVHGTHLLNGPQDFRPVGAEYRELVGALRGGRLTPQEVAGRESLNLGGRVLGDG